MRISKQVHVEGRYHVAIMNPHERSSGACLIPVVCWMVVSNKDEEGDVTDSIVPYIVAPESDDGALMPATLFGEDDFLGIVSPGDEIDHVYNDLANERISAEGAQDKRADLKKAVTSTFALLTMKEIEILKLLNVADTHYQGLERAEVADLHRLTELMCIAPHRYDICTTWHVTEIGREICHHQPAIRRTPVHGPVNAELPEDDC